MTPRCRSAPDDAQIRVNRVVALLRAGRWTEAWPDYEWRLRLAGQAAQRPRLLPALSGLADLTGLTIPLRCTEDGFGDDVAFRTIFGRCWLSVERT